MNKTHFYAKKRTHSAPSKRTILISLKNVKKKAEYKPTGVRINAKRINSESIHEQRVLFNLEHFGQKKFYHQNGKKTWVAPIVKKETPAVTYKRIMQIIVPPSFFYVTDRTRKKLVCKRDECHRVRATEEVTVHVIAHAENAAKEMLLKNGINKDAIMTNKNVCYVTLHKKEAEEKIREIFPTLHIRVFKVKN